MKKNKFLSAVAFYALAFVAIALILAKLNFLGSIQGALTIIANALSYIVLMVIAYNYVAEKQKNLVWIICYIVIVVLIVVTFIL